MKQAGAQDRQRNHGKEHQHRGPGTGLLPPLACPFRILFWNKGAEWASQHQSPAEQVLAAGSFPGTRARLSAVETLQPLSRKLGRSQAEQKAAQPPPLAAAWHQQSRQRLNGCPSKVLSESTDISSPRTAAFSRPKQARSQYRGVSWHNWELAGYFPGLLQAPLETFLNKRATNSLQLHLHSSPRTLQHLHTCQVMSDGLLHATRSQQKTAPRASQVQYLKENKNQTKQKKH